MDHGSRGMVLVWLGAGKGAARPRPGARQGCSPARLRASRGGEPGRGSPPAGHPRGSRRDAGVRESWRRDTTRSRGDRVLHPPGVRTRPPLLPMHLQATLRSPLPPLRGHSGGPAGMPCPPPPRAHGAPEQRLTGQPPGRAAARRRAVLSGHGAAPSTPPPRRGLRHAWPRPAPGSRRRRARRRGGEGRGEGRARRCRLGPVLPPPPTPSSLRPQMCRPQMCARAKTHRGGGTTTSGSRGQSPRRCSPPIPDADPRPRRPDVGGAARQPRVPPSGWRERAPAAPRTALPARPGPGAAGFGPARCRPRAPSTGAPAPPAPGPPGGRERGAGSGVRRSPGRRDPPDPLPGPKARVKLRSRPRTPASLTPCPVVATAQYRGFPPRNKKTSTGSFTIS